MTSDTWLFITIVVILTITLWGIITAPPYDGQHDDDW